MITDLNVQLKGLYDQSQTFAVSVDSLTQPSLNSLSPFVAACRSSETATAVPRPRTFHKRPPNN